jgi:hypothetical protein
METTLNKDVSNDHERKNGRKERVQWKNIERKTLKRGE